MKKLLDVIICVVIALTSWAGSKDKDEYIQVDWYPLCTDSVGWNIYTGGFVIGWDNASGIDVNMGRSIDIGWLNVIGTKFKTRHGQRITAGVGIDWRNFKLNNGVHFQQNNDYLSVVPYPEGANPKSSRVKVFSLTVPVLVRQRMFSTVDIFAGPVVNFNLHASVETIYTLNGEKVKESSNKIHQVPVTVDILGGIKWKFIGVFVRYSPCHVLQERHAVAFTPFTTGIIMGF
ncbi:MAG: hypothetical protein IJP59_10635 [Muribaculaceae bacterium]|nr:hypothetical protein [Muribaculaceae bacterium]